MGWLSVIHAGRMLPQEEQMEHVIVLLCTCLPLCLSGITKPKYIQLWKSAHGFCFLFVVVRGGGGVFVCLFGFFSVKVTHSSLLSSSGNSTYLLVAYPTENAYGYMHTQKPSFGSLVPSYGFGQQSILHNHWGIKKTPWKQHKALWKNTGKPSLGVGIKLFNPQNMQLWMQIMIWVLNKVKARGDWKVK